MDSDNAANYPIPVNQKYTRYLEHIERLKSQSNILYE